MSLYRLLGSHCACSKPEVLGQPEEEAELGAGMLGDLEEEGPGDVHPGEWIQNILSLHPLRPIVSFPTAKLLNAGYQQPIWHYLF